MNHIAVALEFQSIANALELVVPILVLRPQMLSVLAQVEIFSVGSSHLPLQRTSATAGYQERKIPKPLPYRPQLSSPLCLLNLRNSTRAFQPTFRESKDFVTFPKTPRGSPVLP
jgi:hypothetical protein